MQIKLVYPDGQSAHFAQETPSFVSQALHSFGISFDLPCGGKTRCHKCKIRATGKLSPLSEAERRFLTPQEQKDHIRYACMAKIEGDVTLTLLSAPKEMTVLSEGLLPSLERQPLGKDLGIAVDIGTTTVVAYLIDCNSGQRLATASCRNPQAAFGADVISRLEKSISGESAALAQSIRQCLDGLFSELKQEAKISQSRVDAMVVTGNTAMLYLLCQQDPECIAMAPFLPDRNFGEWLSAKELGLNEVDCPVYLPRCLSAYVGADITTAIMAADLLSYTTPTLLADIGTNGEMALWADGQLFCCSTAAGPAFEGAGIYQGMPASPGAVSQVWLEGKTICYKTIGDAPAIGLCGSGLVDFVAVLCQLHIIDDSGLLLEEGHAYTNSIQWRDGQAAFCLPGTNVLLTQKDIRSLQLAKSAVCSGMEILMQEAGRKPEDITLLLLAGGFGSFLKVESAGRIGLIPPLFTNKTRSIGNAAGMGAVMILQSRPCLEQSETLADGAETIELSTHAAFMDAYVNNMFFPEDELV